MLTAHLLVCLAVPATRVYLAAEENPERVVLQELDLTRDRESRRVRRRRAHRQPCSPTAGSAPCPCGGACQCCAPPVSAQRWQVTVIKTLTCRRLALPVARGGQLARWKCATGSAAPPRPRRAAYRGATGWVRDRETYHPGAVGLRSTRPEDFPKTSALHLGNCIDGK